MFKLLVPVGALLAFSTMANATLVAPGGNGAPTGTSTVSGTVLADTGVQTATTSTLSVSYEEQVYQTNNVFCTGCLDFVITATDIGTDDLERITAGNFAGVLTDADYVSGTGVAAPFLVTRSVDGSAVGFLFSAVPGNSIDTLVIQTNATTYVPGTLSFQNDFTANGTGYGVAPEPNMVCLLSVFAIGILGVAYRRKKAAVKS